MAEGEALAPLWLISVVSLALEPSNLEEASGKRLTRKRKAPVRNTNATNLKQGH